MVKLCVICGIMDGDNDVSMHRIPTDVRRLQWVEFVVKQGFPVNPTSKLCSRHFIPGHDYIEGEAQRRRLRHTAIPSLVFGPYREREDHVENVDAGIQVQMDEFLLEENIEVVEVMMVNDNIEVVKVAMDDNNVEIVEVLINGDEQVPVKVEVVSDDDNFVGVFDLSPLYNIEEVEQIAPVVARLLLDRPAGVQHPLPEPHNIGTLNYVCQYCRARHFKCEETSPNHFSTCCNNGLMAVSGLDRPAGVQHPLPELHNIGTLNYVCQYCRARHFKCEESSPNHFSTCCNNGLMAVSGLDRPAGVQHPLPEPHNIGTLNYVCQYCRARHFKCEETSPNHFSTCCNNGLMAVSRPRVLTPSPHLLQRLLVEDSVDGRHYRNNIRQYNNTLEFAAFSTDLNTRRLPGRGPNVFTVHGQGYWTISNDLIGNDPIQRRFCQLYFVESASKTMREVWAGENAPGRDP
ncbi:uncharacterized protein LOC132934613 [Metopolophium dirhodum]|uniref:uncharacterized protein LOC132934613 n=1 Tax=Metopolophium dirhodum TaxID=44670 RepID=UPI002990134C|nr:uncharacterized protein LOC132934613 [Metopolophium dirhodum]